jgi:mercuric ion binding protein
MKKIFIGLVLLFLSISVSFSKTVNIKIDKMHCPLCTVMIKKAIKNVDGVEKVKVRLNTKIATVTYDSLKIDDNAILKAIETTTYTGVVIKE